MICPFAALSIENVIVAITVGYPAIGNDGLIVGGVIAET
jgi:hypothetical protein